MLPFELAVLVIPSVHILSGYFNVSLSFVIVSLTVQNCDEFPDTAPLSLHLTQAFHNLGARYLKECFP